MFFFFFFLPDIVMEETPPTPTPAPPPATPPVVAPPAPAPPSPAGVDREGRRGGGRLGLTKEVLLAHTQREEQHFLLRFRDLHQLRVFDPGSAPHPLHATPFARGTRPEPTASDRADR